MSQIYLYSILSVLVVSVISLVGVFSIPIQTERLKKLLLYFVSFSAGALMGDVFIHLLPEVINEGYTINSSVFILFGIVFSFIMEKFIQWRHCHLPITQKHQHPFVLMNLFGDAIHNFIDGLIIGSSYLTSIPLGISTTIAIALHEIPQEVGDFGVLLHGGYSKTKALLFNFAIALTAIIGTVAVLITNGWLQQSTQLVNCFAIGTFIYIAGSDLIPELHKEGETRKNLKQIVSFIFGILIMFSLLLLEK